MIRALVVASGLVLLVAAFARSDAEETPAPPAPLNPGAAADDLNELFPDVETDSRGTWVAVWTAEDPAYRGDHLSYNVAVTVSRNNGHNWSHPNLITTEHNLGRSSVYSAKLATDGRGVWVAVWSVGTQEFSDSDVFFSRSTDNAATWSPPAPLNPWFAEEIDPDYYPEIATDGGGGWVIVWQSENPLDIVVDQDTFFSRSIDNGATWSTPGPIDTDYATVKALDSAPRIVSTGSSWAVVFASRRSSPAHGSDSDIFYSVSQDAAQTWSVPALIDPIAMSDSDGDSSASVGGSGGRVIATWVTPGVGSGSDSIRVSGSDDSGLTWSAPLSLTTSLPPASFSKPEVDSTLDGRWIIGWGVFSPSYDDAYDILGAVSTNNGDTWSTPSYLNSNGASDTTDEVNPQVALSESGMGVAVWNSFGRYGDPYGEDMDVFYTRCLPLSRWRHRWPPADERGSAAGLGERTPGPHACVRDGGRCHGDGCRHAGERLLGSPAYAAEPATEGASVSRPYAEVWLRP